MGQTRDGHPSQFCQEKLTVGLKLYVNKKNCHIFSDDNQQAIIEPPLHPQGVTVLCALWPERISCLCISLQNRTSHNVTVNGERCRTMSNAFFVKDVDMANIWFQ